MYLIGILVFPLILRAEAVPVETQIKSVTVFLNGAQVNRTGKVSLTTGKQEFVFKGISPKLNPGSIQVKIEGENTLLSVTHKINHLEEMTQREELKMLETRQKEMMHQINTEKALLNVYAQEEIMLGKNQEIGGSQTGVKTVDLKEAVDFQRQRLTEVKLKMLESNLKLKETGEALRKINAQISELNQKKDRVSAEIYITLQSPRVQQVGANLSYLIADARWTPTYDIRVKDIASPLTLGYKANVLQNSGEDWKDVRLTLSTGNPNLGGEKPQLQPWHLGYISGYSTPVSVTTPAVSYSANPYRSVSGKITDEKGLPVMGAAVYIEGSNIGSYTDESGNYSLIGLGPQDLVLKAEALGYDTRQTTIQNPVMNLTLLPLVTDIEEVVISGKRIQSVAALTPGVVTGGTPADYGDSRGARSGDIEYYVDGVRVRGTPGLPEKAVLRVDEATLKEASLTNFQFDIEVSYTIPSDGKEYTAEISTHQIPAYYEYYCAPKIDPDAFLTANITKWEPYQLVDGETNVFFEGTYVGKGYLSPRLAGDTLTVSLGRDKSVIITRTLFKDFSKNQLAGNFKTQSIAWEITARNTKKLPVQLILEDQFPVSDLKEITVERLDSGGASIEDNTGKLTWKFTLEAGKERKTGFKYSVKYPKNSNVIVK